jgi:hypothetical protein
MLIKRKFAINILMVFTLSICLFLGQNDEAIARYGQGIEPGLISIDIVSGSDYLLPLTAKKINSFDGETFILNYDPSELTLVDLSAQTKNPPVTGVGQVEETEIEILSVDNGSVTLKVDQQIPAGKMWSGVLTIAKFKAKATTKSTVRFMRSGTDYFTVAFVDWDGKILKKQLVAPGLPATAPADPTREDYTFAGWDADFSSITGDLTVTAQYIILKLSQTTITPPATGGEDKVTITSNIPWEVSCNATWIEVSPASGSGNGELTIVTVKNTTSSQRSATITVSSGGTGKEIEVIQDKFEFILLVPSSITAQGAGDKLKVDVICNTDWKVSPPGVNWATIIGDTGFGNGCFSIKVDPNTTSVTRNVMINVRASFGGLTKDGVIMLNQSPLTPPNPPSLELLPPGISDSGSGGSYTIDVRCNTSWKISSNSSWTKVSGSPGPGNDDFIITIERNTSPAPRTAVITVETTYGDKDAKKTLLISQDVCPPEDEALYIREATGDIGTIGRVLFEIPADEDFLNNNALVCNDDIDVEIYYSPKRTENAIAAGQNTYVFAVRFPNGETREEISFSFKPIGGDIEKNEIIIYGDVNEDKYITTTDATLVTRWAGGNTAAVLKNILAADVNGDAYITTTDATLITRRAGGNTATAFSIEARF